MTLFKNSISSSHQVHKSELNHHITQIWYQNRSVKNYRNRNTKFLFHTNTTIFKENIKRMLGKDWKGNIQQRTISIFWEKT